MYVFFYLQRILILKRNDKNGILMVWNFKGGEQNEKEYIPENVCCIFVNDISSRHGQASVPAAVKKGTDISASKAWQSFSVQTGEDKNEWKNALIKDGQKYDNKENVFKSYTENASMKTKTPKSFLMDIVSTGSSAQWGPSKKVDDLGNVVWEAKMSNPWGVTATKIVNIEKGRTYTISFKIKSTLENEIKKTQNVPGKYYYETKDKKGKTIVHYTTSVVNEKW